MLVVWNVAAGRTPQLVSTGLLISLTAIVAVVFVVADGVAASSFIGATVLVLAFALVSDSHV